ncbi:MAG TPA: PilN domain-containing protein [Deltaproteobacteria bacterium]|nr:PilN domain-containing protein [Deltaproteobacteria bacterium]HPR54361.1 PilN domain-containing protein [Deltaproteobacteria bacterium]HXK47000.1 PilN domain-containing protein [Deltaproteobacteria bacterium]
MLCIVLVLIGEYFAQLTVTNQRESLQKEIADTKVEIKRLTAEAGEIEKFKKQKQELERKLDVIQDLNAKKTGPVEMLDELSLIIPEKAWLTSVTNKGDNIVLEGLAVDNPTIAAFMKQLQASKHFDNVTLVLSKQESGQQKFSITCKIKLTT